MTRLFRRRKFNSGGIVVGQFAPPRRQVTLEAGETVHDPKLIARLLAWVDGGVVDVPQPSDPNPFPRMSLLPWRKRR